MPYPRAWLWVSGLLVLTVPAFWPSYFGQLESVKWQYHMHGATAGLWILLVIIQNWTIHHGRGSLHRAAGLTSLLLAPLFLAGGMLVIATISSGSRPFTELFGARLALIDAVSLVGFAAFICLALKHRRKVRLHASWMLATVIPLINPTLARLFPAFMPGLTIRSVEELPRFALSFHLAQAVAFGITLLLYLRDRRNGTPLLVAMSMLIVQSVLFETVGRTAWWSEVHAQIGAISPGMLVAFGISAGAVAVAAGWLSRTTPRSAAQATS